MCSLSAHTQYFKCLLLYVVPVITILTNKCKFTSSLLLKYGKLPPLFKCANLACGYDLYISSLTFELKALSSHTSNIVMGMLSNACGCT